MKLFTSLLILLLFCSFSLNSQFVRKVVVEEATNASCGPCASQNPIFKKWLDNHLDRVIPIVYHAWWPGSKDPMYLYDTLMNQNRIRYYGINSVPTGRVNGKIAPSSGSYYAGAVADTVALNNQLNSESFYSTISISFADFNVDKMSGQGSVKLNAFSIKPISNLFLRIAICEEHHYYANAGSNGEKDFLWVARKMLPNASGTSISLNANETKTFEFSFNIDTSFTDDLYAVAFIQDDKTKEILQGAWTKNYPVNEPKYALLVLGTNLTSVLNSKDEMELEAVVLNNTPIATTFTISLEGKNNIPTDWEAKVLENNSEVTVQAKSIYTIKAWLKVGETPFASDLKLKIQTTDGKFTQTGPSWKVYHSGIQRLNILGGEDKHSIQSTIESKLPPAYIFEISESDFISNSSKFSSLKTIVWNGSTNGDFTANSANIIFNALNKNQNIMICGGKITSGMVSNGVLPYFGIGFIAYCREGYGQAPYPVTLAGVAGDPITGDFGTNIQGYLISYLLPLFRITNSNTTTPIMTFAKSVDSICAIKAQLTKSRAVILGMNPYIIFDANVRNNLISRSLLWLEDKLSEVVNDIYSNQELSIYPNPASSVTYLSLSLEYPVEYGKIELYDVEGKLVRNIFEGTFSIGKVTIPIFLAGLPSQSFYLRVKLGNQERFLPIMKTN